MAVYEVKSPDGKITLVETRTSKTAIAHVSSKGYTTTTLKMSDVVKRVKAGVQIENVEEVVPVAGNDATTATPADVTAATVNGSDASVTTGVEAETSKSSFAGRFTKKSA